MIKKGELYLCTMISSQLRKSLANFLSKNSSLVRESSVSLSAPCCLFSTSRKPVEAPSACEKPLNSDSVAFFKKHGFSDKQLERVVKKRRQLMSADLENTVKPKFKILRDFGFSKFEIAEIITKEPTILCSSFSRRVIPSLRMLKDLFSSHAAIVKALKKSRWFLITDLKMVLLPNIEFLKSRGQSMENIVRLLSFYPSILFFKNEVLRKHVEKLEAMGVDSRSKMFIYCLMASGSLSNEVWKLKLHTFMDLGFSETETLAIFKKTPTVFTISPEKITRVAKVILATNRYTLSDLKANPLSLCCSIDNRIRPRLQVLEILEKTKLIKKWPKLCAICAYTDEKFHNRFVAGHLEEVGHLYTELKKKSLRSVES